MRIAFIGFGEAARAFCDGLAETAPDLAVSAYDILLDDAVARSSMEAGMRERGVTAAASPHAAVERAEWIFSAVTADQSQAAASAVAPHLRAGQLFIDINSVSPDQKRANAKLVAPASYLDMAVMAPVHPKRQATPVLIAGAETETLLSQLGALGFDASVAGDRIGAATAIKMVRSLFVKGLEAITVEALLAASASGCLPEVLRSIGGSFPGLGWPDFAGYQLERTLKHGARRAAEMRECAATIDALGLTGGLPAAIAEVQDAMGALAPVDLGEDELEAEIAKLAALRSSGG